MNAKIPTSKRSYTGLHRLLPVENYKKLKPVTQISSTIRTPQDTWARSNAQKAQAFANHLANVFQPHPSDSTSTPEATHTSLLETYFQLEPLLTASNDPRYTK
jgi:hypothetical protein